MSDLLNQAKSAATTAVNTASDLATQASSTAQSLVNQAVASDTTASLTDQASKLGTQASSMAGNLAGQAHAQAHVMAPSVIPAPTAFHASGTTSATGEVDRSEVIEPDNKQETAKFEKLFDSRPTADELVDKGILKGDPTDSLAGKRADLEKAMMEDKLDAEIAQRPSPEELVQKGIISPEDAPPAV